MDFKILKYESLDSTNIKAKEIALDSEEGTVVVAREQTMGKGRMGKAWLSKKDMGLWMTIILKPKIQVQDVSRITLISAASVCKTLDNMGVPAEIKWPNDIVVEGRKICGILTETNTNMEGIKHILLGIGININQNIDDFPQEIQSRSTSLSLVRGKNIDIDLLLNSLLERFEEYYISFTKKGDLKQVVEINRIKSALIGREVYVIDGKGLKRNGRVLDVNEKGELVVDFPEGIEKLVNGQVSVRGLDGYV